MTAYSFEGDRAPADAIFEYLLKFFREAELCIPRSVAELFQVLDKLLDATVKARSYKIGAFGWIGGKSADSRYTVKHFTRIVLLELAVLLATNGEIDRRSAGGAAGSSSSAAAFSASAAGSGSSPPKSARRRIMSTLLLRAEDIVGGSEVAALFEDIKLSELQRFCPLEEAALMEAFKGESFTLVVAGCRDCSSAGIAQFLGLDLSQVAFVSGSKDIQKLWKHISRCRSLSPYATLSLCCFCTR